MLAYLCYVKPCLHQIHVSIDKYPRRATCIRLQVDTCRRDNTPIHDTCRRRQGYKCIQLVSKLHVSGVNAALDASNPVYM